MQDSAKLRKKIEIPHPGRTRNKTACPTRRGKKKVKRLADLRGDLLIERKFDSCTGKVTVYALLSEDREYE